MVMLLEDMLQIQKLAVYACISAADDTIDSSIIRKFLKMDGIKLDKPEILFCSLPSGDFKSV